MNEFSICIFHFSPKDVTIIAKVTESSKNYKINKILYDNSSLIEKFAHSEIKKEIKNKLQKSTN